ncbi:MAG: pirin [Rudaea sp.]|uniref:replication protein RepA n=1 Tax=unclassified Rudaea TaxID=2627037 RepID=UPI0010F95456|nr:MULTISPECIES: replication protein RepA [unclassified Rudaea]MBN8888441.1 pirin [Rudaea sp.]
MTSRQSGAMSSEARRFIEQAAAIQDVDPRDARSLGYTARILTIATLPHRAQPGDHYERQNGGYRLIVQTVPGAGLPFGSYPRLLLSWLSTEIVRTRSRELELGRSMAQFLDQLGLSRSGGRGCVANAGAPARSAGTIWRLRGQIARLFGARFILQNLIAEGEGIEILPIGDRVQLWAGEEGVSGRGFPSAVRVSEPFFEHVLRGPVPVDLRALRALKRSPLALDLYTWLTYRAFVQRNGGRAAAAVPWPALQAQFGADYPLGSRGLADFKKAFHLAYRRVQIVYPAAQLDDLGHSLAVLASAPHIRARRFATDV